MFLGVAWVCGRLSAVGVRGITIAEWGDGYGWGNYLCAACTIFVFLVRMLAGYARVSVFVFALLCVSLC